MGELVLVTGASGFVATHIVQQLQRAGHRVRGTVRSLKNESKVAPLRNLCPDAKYPVELVEADLNSEDKWPEAVEGCTYVLHVASPFPAENPANEDELIKPAVDGTLNVLKACKTVKSLKRVVLTSSVAAIEGGNETSEFTMFNEETWTDLTKKNISTYYKSKTLAERAAWDFVRDLEEGEKFELVVLNPGMVFGPVLCGPMGTSVEIVKQILEKQMPMVPAINLPLIDVRDVAAAHIKAMTAEGAAGHRHILAHSNIWFKDIALIIEAEFKTQGYNIPTKQAPSCMIRFLSIFDRSLKSMVPSLGKEVNVDNTRMKSVLGIEPIEPKDTILDMCYSMVETGKAKKTNGYTGPKFSNH